MKLLKLGIATIISSGMLFANDIILNAPDQFPEGVEYNTKTGDFFLSSLTGKGIIKVNKNGEVKPFSLEAPLPIAGIHIDYNKNKLYAAGLDRKEAFDKDPNTHGYANLFIYDLDSGKLEANINLAATNPNNEAYFANDITNDNDGNIYISDFTANAIYKVDKNNKESLFYKGDELGRANGLEVVNNILLVSDISPRDGKWQLVKIPLENPSNATRVIMNDDIYRSFDGMLANSDGSIVGVTHNEDKSSSILLKIISNDNWKSAKVVSSKASSTRLTTIARVKDGSYFALQQNFKNPRQVKWILEDIKLD